MRPRGPAEFLEERRQQALMLLDEGLSLNELGRPIGCAPSSVMHWRDMRRRGRARALKVRSSPGRPSMLSLAACRLRLELLLEGAMANGYPTQLWSSARLEPSEAAQARLGTQGGRVPSLRARGLAAGGFLLTATVARTWAPVGKASSSKLTKPSSGR